MEETVIVNKLNKISRYMIFKYKLKKRLPFAYERGNERRAGRNTHVPTRGRSAFSSYVHPETCPKELRPNAPGTQEESRGSRDKAGKGQGPQGRAGTTKGTAATARDGDRRALGCRGTIPDPEPRSAEEPWAHLPPVSFSAHIPYFNEKLWGQRTQRPHCT